MRRHSIVVMLCVLAACDDSSTPITAVGPVVPAPALLEHSIAVGHPSPGPGSALLFDSRTQLQSATRFEQAIAPWAVTSDDEEDVALLLTRDVDGAGTQAVRIEWDRARHGCREVSPSLGMTLPKPWPRRAYIQWKQHLGRTRTGGGTGRRDAFAIDPTICDALDGRFVWTIGRDEAGANGNRRIDLRWRGTPVRTSVNVKRTGILLEPNQGVDFLPLAHVGRTVLHTLYAQAESTPGAGDGVVRVWADGALVLEGVGLSLGAEAFRRLNFPWTMPAPREAQTEYVWDMVGWVAGVGAVEPEPLPGRLELGATTAARVLVRDSHGAAITGHVPLAWTSSDEGVLAVDDAGAITAVGVGTATIAVQAGDARAEWRIEVLRPGYYVSPTGTADGDGSWDRPWSLATVLGGGTPALTPGATIWMRGGTYVGDFRSTLAGTADAPFVVRQLPGERATIEGRLRADGAYVTYRGFEIRQANALATNWPTLEAYGTGTRYVNLVIHDAGENGISFRTGAGINEVHGCIVFNSGNDRGLDQGIYAPNDGGEKWITGNVFFNNMASGIQVFADESHTAGISDVHVVDNISFNNSSIAVTPTRPLSEENITVGGDLVTRRVQVTGNVLYFSGGFGQNLRVGLEPDSDRPGRRNVDVTVRDNYVVGGATVFRLQHWETAVVQGNTFISYPGFRILRMGGGIAGYQWTGNVFHADATAVWNYNGAPMNAQLWRFVTGLGATDQFLTAVPAVPHVAVRPNKDERGRAHIAVVNWGRPAEVLADVSAVLQPGDRYELRNVQDVYGAPVATGTYTGAPIRIPMAGVVPPPAVGRPGTPPRTGPDFDAFLLTLADPGRIP